MTFANVSLLALGFVLSLILLFWLTAFRRRKRHYVIALILCTILVGTSLLWIIRQSQSTERIHNFESFSIDNLSKVSELIDWSLKAKLETKENSIEQVRLDQTQFGSFSLSFHNGAFANMEYSFFQAGASFPIWQIIQINYVGDIFSETSHGTQNEASASKLISSADLKKFLSIFGESGVIQEIQEKLPTHLEVSFVGIVNLEDNVEDGTNIYVVMQNKVVPFSDIEDKQSKSYRVFNVITDTDNLWVCY